MGGEKKDADDPDEAPNASADAAIGSNRQGARLAKFAVPAAIVGGTAAVLAAPVVVAAVGFGAGGIAAGSAAAGMMSSAWTTGVGMGVVSTLQSVGAAGMGAAGMAATGAVGVGVGGGIGALYTKLCGREHSAEEPSGEGGPHSKGGTDGKGEPGGKGGPDGKGGSDGKVGPDDNGRSG